MRIAINFAHWSFFKIAFGHDIYRRLLKDNNKIYPIAIFSATKNDQNINQTDQSINQTDQINSTNIIENNTETQNNGINGNNRELRLQKYFNENQLNNFNFNE